MKIVSFWAYFGKISTKHKTFHDIPKLIWCILVNFFGLFSHLKIRSFSKLLVAKFGFFIFWDLATMVVNGSRWTENKDSGKNRLEMRPRFVALSRICKQLFQEVQKLHTYLITVVVLHWFYYYSCTRNIDRKCVESRKCVLKIDKFDKNRN